MNFDSQLIRLLRERASQGESPCELAALIGRHLGVSDGSLRILAIAYFRTAFVLRFADAKMIGGAAIFGERRGIEEIDAEMRPRLDATKHLWLPPSRRGSF